MIYYNKIIKHLIKKNITVSIAESCTGGQLSKSFTDFPGVSKIFNLGVITYSNESKINILKISKKIINEYGAVSEKTAYLMSKNLFKITKSKLCISTTGIAGPKGASKTKPLGLVYIGLTFKEKTVVFKKNFKGNRKEIQKSVVFFCYKKIKNLI